MHLNGTQTSLTLLGRNGSRSTPRSPTVSESVSFARLLTELGRLDA